MTEVRRRGLADQLGLAANRVTPGSSQGAGVSVVGLRGSARGQSEKVPLRPESEITTLPTRVGPAEGTTEATISLPSLPDGREGMWLVTVEATALVEASFPAPIVTGVLQIAGTAIDLTFVEDEIATKFLPAVRGAFVALTSDSPTASSDIGVSSPTGAVSIASSSVRLDAYLIRAIDL